MALIACAECNQQISDKASSCPHCGAPIQQVSTDTSVAAEATTQKSGVWKWVLGLPVWAFVLLMAIGSCAESSPDGKARAQSKATIKQCWIEQARKSLDPGTARFAASACEQMEKDYRTRWGSNP